MKNKIFHKIYSKKRFVLFIAVVLLAGGLYLWYSQFAASNNQDKVADMEVDNLDESPIKGGQPGQPEQPEQPEQPGQPEQPSPPVQGEPQQESQVRESSNDTERYVDNGDETVTDKKTGLVWQKGEVSDVSLEQAKQAPEGLSIGGYNDWRMPTILELLSIVDTSLNHPAFNDILGLTDTEYFWSSESTPGASDKAWVLNAGGGVGDKPINESHADGGEKIYSLKCVRGTWEVNSARFVDNEDGTVSDYLQKLVWQQNTISDLSLAEAESYIDELNENGQYLWRLPTMPELAMICDRSLSNPAVDQKYFPSLSSDKYWTSSALSSGGRQWYVDMSVGMTTYDAPETKHAIIVVRTMEDNS